MSRELIISISGMRGIIGENLNASIAADYGAAFGTYIMSASMPAVGVNRTKDFDSRKVDQQDRPAGLRRPKVVIGRDSRPSGQMLESAVTAGLCSAGIDVISLGIVSTPAVGVMLRSLGCEGGVVITASHNPIQYNGIKLLSEQGIAFPKEQAEKIKAIYLEKRLAIVDSINCGQCRSDNTSAQMHVEKTLDIVNAGQIKNKRYKVLLDSVNGAGAAEGKMLLGKLGCEVVAVNAEPTGIFAHTPEPTEENLKDTCGLVVKHGATIGFAQDPDADRLAIIDENGRYIGEEYTLALAAKLIYSHNKGGLAAANLSTSRMIDDIAAASGGRVIRTAVGEANVAGAMMTNGCIIGGEGNGGVIDLRVGPIRDSLVAMALILQLMAETEKTISQLSAEIPAYCMIKKKFEADSTTAEKIIKAAEVKFKSAHIDKTDGCRFDFPDGWIHLRISNTEPVMRIIAEAKTRQAAEEYINTVEKL